MVSNINMLPYTADRGSLGQGVSEDPNLVRNVTFSVETACPPQWWKKENSDFW